MRKTPHKMRRVRLKEARMKVREKRVHVQKTKLVGDGQGRLIRANMWILATSNYHVSL